MLGYDLLKPNIPKSMTNKRQNLTKNINFFQIKSKSNQEKSYAFQSNASHHQRAVLGSILAVDHEL